MKRIILLFFLLSGCATICKDGFPLTEYQEPGNGHRQIDGWCFIGNLWFPPLLIVDFVTLKIYREYPRGFYPNEVKQTVTREQWRKMQRDSEGK